MEEAEEGWDTLTVSGTVIVLAAVLYFIRQFIKGPQFREKVNAKGKVVLVTGASSGIGRQIAKELNLKGGKVYLLVRNQERGNEAVRWMLKYGCDPTRLLVRKCDLNSFASVRSFVADFEKEEDRVDILVNNAGVMFIPKYTTTEDGNETVLQSNHLGHFLLTELLVPKLEASPNARVVIVSSYIHVKADGADVEVMNNKAKFGIVQSYARSKLANVVYAAELTRRLRRRNSGTKVQVNSCHPGAVDTNLVRFSIYTKVLKPIFKPLIWFFLKTDEDGAQTPLYCALSKKVDGISGKYFSGCAEATPHPLAEDVSVGELLYNQSLEACKHHPRD